MDNKQTILQYLKESSGQYISGQELCEYLGVSRTAVWKAIDRLRNEGYEIEAVTNRGYRLVSLYETDVLNEEELTEAMQATDWAGHPVFYRQETGSTNTDIFELSDQGSPEGTLVVSSLQKLGKGRRGRTWISPSAGNIYMSILLRPGYSPESAPVVTLTAAMAVWKALDELQKKFRPEEEKLFFGIKWPNDIVVRGQDGAYRKVCGILTEMRMEETYIRDVVVGIGLNINMKEFDPEIRETASSVSLALGKSVNRAALTAGIWKCFEEKYALFQKTGDMQLLKKEYEEALVNRGRRVRVLDPREPFEGVARGITDNGALLVAPDGSRAGEERAVSAGEVSVRGVEGYV